MSPSAAEFMAPEFKATKISSSYQGTSEQCLSPSATGFTITECAVFISDCIPNASIVLVWELSDDNKFMHLQRFYRGGLGALRGQ